MKKKFLAALLSCAMLGSLFVGCGSEDAGSSAPAQTDSKTEVADAGSANVAAEGAEDAAAHPEYLCESGSMSWNLKINKNIAFNI